MITELIITDKDVRGKYRNHEYSQHVSGGPSSSLKLVIPVIKVQNVT